jgi:uncharacterized membrane protein
MLALVIVAGVVLLFALLVGSVAWMLWPLWWPYFQAWRRQRAMNKAKGL